MRERDIRDEACEWRTCTRPARYRVSGAPSTDTVFVMCGIHMHAMERRGWTSEGKLRKDGR